MNRCTVYNAPLITFIKMFNINLLAHDHQLYVRWKNILEVLL